MMERHEAQLPPTLAGLRQAVVDPWLWLLVLAGLALRLVVAVSMPPHGPISDEAEYYAAARVLAAGGGFSYYDTAPWLRPPGYLLMLAGSFWLFGPTAEPVRWLQVGLSLLFGPLIAWLTGLVDGRWQARRLAAGLTMLLLPLAVIPWLLLTETLFTLVLLLAIGGLTARLRGGRLPWLLLAGLALGLACLLRGLAVGFVGIVIAGLLLRGPGPLRRRLVEVLLLTAVVVAVILPWTARNWVAYRAIIPLETTAAYNLWLRAQGGRGESWMLGELREQPNLPARQAHALSRGLALISQDRMTYVSRGLLELGDVWRLNFGAAERLMSGFSAGEVNRLWLGLSLVLDDLLYLALLPLAMIGAVRAGGPGRWLIVGWIGWTALSALLFFAIVRFRVPLLPLLALLAAVGLLNLGHLLAALRQPRRWAGLVFSSTIVLLVLLLPGLDRRAYLIGWQARPHWELAEQAERRRQAGEPTAALAMLDAAGTSGVVSALVRGLALAQLGRSAAAENALGPYWADDRAQVVVGEIRRLAGDPAGASRIWGQRAIDVANPLDWAWQRVGQPSARVDVGDGLDIGLVRGVHPDERDGGRRFRWTNGEAAVRLMPPAAGRYRLVALVRGYRPAPWPAATLRLVVNGHAQPTIVIGDTWQEAVFDLDLPAGQSVVELVSSSFVSGAADPRTLGLMLDSVVLNPVG